MSLLSKIKKKFSREEAKKGENIERGFKRKFKIRVYVCKKCGFKTWFRHAMRKHIKEKHYEYFQARREDRKRRLSSSQKERKGGSIISEAYESMWELI